MEELSSLPTNDVADSRSLKILLVAMADSIHVAKWIDLYRGSNTHFVLVPSGPNRRVHPRIKSAVRGEISGVTVSIEPKFLSWAGLPVDAVDKLLAHRVRGFLLRRVFKRYEFDLVHVQELQHAGYTALAAFRRSKPRLLYVSNWGSDIFWFSRFARHRKRISALLEIATHYSAECHRDLKMAVDLGFRGEVLPVIPNAGGLPEQQIQVPTQVPSRRRRILVKGYTGFVGQAIVALRALRDARGLLADHEILVYSASYKARMYGLYLKTRYRMNVRTLPPGVDHATMLDLFRSARLYLGVSLSDGISTSLLEAMATGCFPIQTNTSCGNEWLNEKTGILVSPDDPAALLSAIQSAMSDDDLVDQAADINKRVMLERATSEEVARSARQLYSRIISES